MANAHKAPIFNNGPPTHPALHVRDAKDAHIVLEAVRLNMLPLIRRRLTASEREQLSSGNVFVWEEAESDGGLLRWTDGRRWSQSRMRGDYLFYEEKMETTQEEKDAKAALRARRASDPLAITPSTNRRKNRPSKPNGFTKQTYSALVYLPGSSHARKWHVVAYFSGDDYLCLPTIENYDYLRSLKVPDGIFQSSKANGLRGDGFPCSFHSGETYDRSGYIVGTSPGHYSHPMPQPYYHDVPIRPLSSSSSSSSTLLSPLQVQPLALPSGNTKLARHEISLPGITTLVSPRSRAEASADSRTASLVTLERPSLHHPYSPLSAEDRRVLNSFRVVL